MTQTTALKCQHCGHVGPDVGPHTAYKGGDGYIVTIQCTDLMACWARWQELVKQPDAISELEE